MSKSTSTKYTKKPSTPKGNKVAKNPEMQKPAGFVQAAMHIATPEVLSFEKRLERILRARNKALNSLKKSTLARIMRDHVRREKEIRQLLEAAEKSPTLFLQRVATFQRVSAFCLSDFQANDLSALGDLDTAVRDWDALLAEQAKLKADKKEAEAKAKAAKKAEEKLKKEAAKQAAADKKAVKEAEAKAKAEAKKERDKAKKAEAKTKAKAKAKERAKAEAKKAKKVKKAPAVGRAGDVPVAAFTAPAVPTTQVAGS